MYDNNNNSYERGQMFAFNCAVTAGCFLLTALFILFCILSIAIG